MPWQSKQISRCQVRWVAIFEDSEEMLQVRKTYEPAHFEYLAANESEIVLVGGLRNAAAGSFVGGLWVLEVSSRERAVELIERDPYFVHGVRSYRLHVWGKAFPERQVVL
jgi:uncharacterized protein